MIDYYSTRMDNKNTIGLCSHGPTDGVEAVNKNGHMLDPFIVQLHPSSSST